MPRRPDPVYNDDDRHDQDLRDSQRSDLNSEIESSAARTAEVFSGLVRGDHDAVRRALGVPPAPGHDPLEDDIHDWRVASAIRELRCLRREELVRLEADLELDRDYEYDRPDFDAQRSDEIRARLTAVRRLLADSDEE